jgi:hypothetical protein
MTKEAANRPLNASGDESCPICLARAAAGSEGGPCDNCCKEFLARQGSDANAIRQLCVRMAQESWMIIGFVLGLAAVAISTTVVASHYRGSVPLPVAATIRTAHVAIMAWGIALCLRADASARAMPRAPTDVADRRLRHAGLEDLIPGAAPSALALVLPWAIGIHGSSAILTASNLVLAVSTVAAATVIIYKSRVLARMRVTCQGDPGQRGTNWRRVSPTRSASAAALLWLAALSVGCIGALSLGSSPGAILDGAADAGLSVGALLWLIAFRQAGRECRNQHTWIGPEGA